MNLIEKKESDSKLIDLAYILGIALIISAVVYFFAANWGGLERGEKVILISLLLIGFYGLAFLLDRFLVVRPLVGKLAFFSGVLAFGVSAALLGQVYNSHADSYLLFFIWLIPALLFSLITRYQMFDVLTYILAHLTFFFYLFPTSVSFFRSANEMLAYLLILSFLNLGLFVLLKKKWIDSPLLTYVSFSVFHMIWFGLTMRGMFADYSFLLNVGYNFILIGMFYFFIKKQQAQIYIVFTTIAYALYVLEALFSWMIYRAAEWLYLLNMVIAFALIVLTILFIRWMTKRMQLNKTNDGAHDHGENRKPWWHKLLVEVTSLVSAILLAGAFIGLTALLSGEFLFSFYIGLAMTLLLLVSATAKKLDEIVIHALVYFSLLLSFVAVWESSIFFFIIYLLLLLVVWIRIGSTTLRTIMYGAGFLLLFILMFRFEFTFEADILFLFLLNASVLVASFMIQGGRKPLLTKLALFYSLLFGFILTFLFGDSPLYYYSFNFLFFIITTAAGFYFIKENKKSLAKIVFIFWFAFLAYKYYDVVWTLLHKSIGLFIIGAVFFLVAVLFDRRKIHEVGKKIMPKKLPILSVILLQLLFIGYQYTVNERVLAHGDLIKLELQPIDPRSMLQGDYVRVSYEISRIPELEGELQRGQKIAVVLSPNEDGFYEYSGVYKHKGTFNRPYEENEEDVLMNATFVGYDQLNYGIESYFIEEGIGGVIEQEATEAYVKVAASGNAILEKVQ